MRTRFNSYVIGLTMLAALLFGVSALGQEASKSITLNRDGKVDGQVLTKGSYNLKFDESKSGELVFLRGKKEVVKAAYDVVKLNAPASNTAIVFTVADDGSFQIKRIEFKGNDTAIAIK